MRLETTNKLQVQVSIIIILATTTSSTSFLCSAVHSSVWAMRLAITGLKSIALSKLKSPFPPAPAWALGLLLNSSCKADLTNSSGTAAPGL